MRDQPLDKIKEYTGLTAAQIATAQARLFGETEVQDKQEVEPLAGRPVGETPKLRAATPWDKLVEANLTEESKREVAAAKAKIPKPKDIFTEAAIAKHLGEFAAGAHAFIDPDTSGKIIGTIKDSRFKGWGVDANFVAPLGEAEALHQKALGDKGIVTLENKLGIKDWNWSKTEDNPDKKMVRWTIPKPLDFKLENNIPFLSMATGNETGAYINEWVAGGFTLGGMAEAVVQAIPRERLIKSIVAGEIKNETVVYAKTTDNIGKEGPGSLDPTSKYYKTPLEKVADL